MKEIIAIIRQNKMNVTKRALTDIGISSLTACKVMGRGKGKVDYLLLKGAEAGYEEAISQLGPGPKMLPKRILFLTIPDNMVQKTVKALIRVNQSGNPGDGKIFVLPVLDAIRVRTGEKGEDALDDFTPKENTQNDVA